MKYKLIILYIILSQNIYSQSSKQLEIIYNSIHQNRLYENRCNLTKEFDQFTKTNKIYSNYIRINETVDSNYLTIKVEYIKDINNDSVFIIYFNVDNKNQPLKELGKVYLLLDNGKVLENINTADDKYSKYGVIGRILIFDYIDLIKLSHIKLKGIRIETKYKNIDVLIKDDSEQRNILIDLIECIKSNY